MEGAHLWKQLQNALAPSEVEEARRVIGRELLESIADAENEVQCLEEILDMYREQVDEDMAKLSAKPALPPPPVLEYVEREIQFFVTQLRDRAAMHGVDSETMVRPQTPKEEAVLKYVSRPGTAGPRARRSWTFRASTRACGRSRNDAQCTSSSEQHRGSRPGGRGQTVALRSPAAGF